MSPDGLSDRALALRAFFLALLAKCYASTHVRVILSVFVPFQPFGKRGRSITVIGKRKNNRPPTGASFSKSSRSDRQSKKDQRDELAISLQRLTMKD